MNRECMCGRKRVAGLGLLLAVCGALARRFVTKPCFAGRRGLEQPRHPYLRISAALVRQRTQIRNDAANLVSANDPSFRTRQGDARHSSTCAPNVQGTPSSQPTTALSTKSRHRVPARRE